MIRLIFVHKIVQTIIICISVVISIFMRFDRILINNTTSVLKHLPLKKSLIDSIGLLGTQIEVDSHTH